MTTEDLQEYCTAGTIIREEMVSVTSHVSLRLITFTPPHQRFQASILFVAGWISLMRGWKSVLRELTSDFAVYYIETREKLSSRINGRVNYGVQEIGGDLVPVVKHIGLNNYVLVGSSLGATAILDSYKSLMPKPRCLVLIGPNAVFRVPTSWKIIVTVFYAPLYSLIRPMVKWYLRTFRLNVIADLAQYEKYCEALDAADPRKLKKAVMSVWSYEVWKKLGSIDCPVLVVNASQDKLHEPENLRKIITSLPNAVEVDLGINSQTHDKPMVDALRNFLGSIPAISQTTSGRHTGHSLTD